MIGQPPRLWQRMVGAVLPADKTFWRLYSPIIKILGDSNEHLLIRNKVNQYLSLNHNDRLLDVGCGKAVWLAEVSSLVRQAVGLDSERRMLTGAAKPAGSFVQADLNAGLPFKDNSFTKIGSLLVDGYLRDIELAISERYRILSPGGVMAVVTPKKGAKFFKVLAAEARHRKEERTIIENIKRLPLAIAAVIFGKIAELKAVVGHWHFFDRDELKAVYLRAGFEVLACDPVYADQAWLLLCRKPR